MSKANVYASCEDSSVATFRSAKPATCSNVLGALGWWMNIYHLQEIYITFHVAVTDVSKIRNLGQSLMLLSKTDRFHLGNKNIIYSGG